MEIERAQTIWQCKKTCLTPQSRQSFIEYQCRTQCDCNKNGQEKDRVSSQFIFHVKRNRDLYAHKFPMFVRGFFIVYNVNSADGIRASQIAHLLRCCCCFILKNRFQTFLMFKILTFIFRMEYYVLVEVKILLFSPIKHIKWVKWVCFGTNFYFYYFYYMACFNPTLLWFIINYSYCVFSLDMNIPGLY